MSRRYPKENAWARWAGVPCASGADADSWSNQPPRGVAQAEEQHRPAHRVVEREPARVAREPGLRVGQTVRLVLLRAGDRAEGPADPVGPMAELVHEYERRVGGPADLGQLGHEVDAVVEGAVQGVVREHWGSSTSSAQAMSGISPFLYATDRGCVQASPSWSCQ